LSYRIRPTRRSADVLLLRDNNRPVWRVRATEDLSGGCCRFRLEVCSLVGPCYRSWRSLIPLLDRITCWQRPGFLLSLFSVLAYWCDDAVTCVSLVSRAAFQLRPSHLHSLHSFRVRRIPTFWHRPHLLAYLWIIPWYRIDVSSYPVGKNGT
jgi:hypothetical protein